MFEQILETGSSRPLKGRSLGGGGVAYIYIYGIFPPNNGESNGKENGK